MDYPEPVPKGLSAKPLGRHRMIIDYERTGMEAMNIFLIVWLSFWTPACLTILSIFLKQSQAEFAGSPEPIPLIMVLGFWTAEITVIILLINSFFRRSSFHLDYADLTIQTRLWRWHWQKKILRSSIQKVLQVQDGGKGRDSFPSWGLKVEGKSPATLMFRQPYEKSEWLGQVIASWAEVPFMPASKKIKRFGLRR